MSLDFLVKALEEDVIPRKKTFSRDVEKLYNVVKNTGVSVAELTTILRALNNLPLDNHSFQGLVLCLIPNIVIPRSVVHKILTWIFSIFKNEEEEKVESLLIWIASLLDFHLIDDSINEWYLFFENVLIFFPKPIAHILYILTRREDVTCRSIQTVQKLLLQNEKEPCLCALLQRYKELNPEYSYVNVPKYVKCEKVFSYDSDFYRALRWALKNVGASSGSVIAESIVIPFAQTKLSNKKILPEPYYIPSDHGQCYLHNITNGAQLGRNFRNLILPSHTLTLMKSEFGIYVLMFSGKKLQNNFFNNLYAVLHKNFFLQPKEVSKVEKERLLNNIVMLHSLFQQGFLQVSKFLTTFLQRWDGLMFRKQIYLLLEWFVFKSSTDLQNNFLKPLYTLFIFGTGDQADTMCDILICLTNLITNLFFMIKKEKSQLHNIYQENIMHTREQLIPVLQNLSKFFSHLCKIGLSQYPCNSKILKIAVDFYEKIDILEDEDVTIRTIISSSVLYHSLLGFNAEILNEVCALMPSYRSRVLSGDYSSPIMNGRYNRLMGYVGDLYNFLWTSRAFVDRMKGRIFYSISSEHSNVWKNHANLNNSLDVLKHIMFESFRSLAVLERDLPNRQFSSKRDALEVLKDHVPHIVNFIETVLANEEKKNEMANEEDEY